MQFITRVLIVLGVLGGLGYGSYAFGKYVLSARLFGPQTGAKTTTAAAGSTGDPSDVEVVPLVQPTPKPDIAESPVVVAQPSATPEARTETTPSEGIGDDSRSTRNSTRKRPEPTRRPRRRRRPRPTSRPQTRVERPRATDPPPAQAPPARTQNVDPPARNNDSDNDTPRVETPREPAPRRERERRTVPRVEPRVERPREPAPRLEQPRRREASPVPVPEGARGGGNSSPIPVPG